MHKLKLSALMSHYKFIMYILFYGAIFNLIGLAPWSVINEIDRHNYILI